MPYDPRGKQARTLEEAEEYIRTFVAETIAHPGRRSYEHLHDYDLYLPWMMEIVENLHASTDEEANSTLELERLYMEAAWSLCMKGYFRPGPRRSNNDNSKDAVGKGYSLTYKGDAWIEDAVEAAEDEPEENSV
jgi:hypothetical protein